MRTVEPGASVVHPPNPGRKMTVLAVDARETALCQWQEGSPPETRTAAFPVRVLEAAPTDEVAQTTEDFNPETPVDSKSIP
jgi:hypothetical protein